MPPTIGQDFIEDSGQLLCGMQYFNFMCDICVYAVSMARLDLSVPFRNVLAFWSILVFRSIKDVIEKEYLKLKNSGNLARVHFII